jgi:hypothetical protein
MSFLNQLKNQAQAVQAQQIAVQKDQTDKVEAVERATHMVWRYLDDLAAQLKVLQPDGPRLSADGKTPWPAMRCSDFRVDARRKAGQGRELFDYVAMGWRLTPKMGVVVQGTVAATFVPEMERIEARLHAGQVKFDRVENRVPPRNALQSVRYDYQTEARGAIRIQPHHAEGSLEFRLTCVTGLELVTKVMEAGKLQTAHLDELAKLLVGQNGQFL